MPGIECLVYEVLESQVNCWILPTSQRRLLFSGHSPKVYITGKFQVVNEIIHRNMVGLLIANKLCKI
jgi:hypothetical protein